MRSVTLLRLSLLGALGLGLLGATGRSLSHVGPPGAEGTQVRALMVGVSDFQNLDATSDLRYAAADARALGETLLASTGGALAVDDLHILTDRDATMPGITAALGDVLGAADAEDLVILFLSTHGVLVDGEGYLITWETEFGPRLPYTSLPVRNLELAIGRTAARAVVLFTDACHSGAVGYNGAKDGPANPVNSVIQSVRQSPGKSFFNQASSLVFQTSLEDPAWCGGHGAYTCALMRALEGAGDHNRDGSVNLVELKLSVEQQVYGLTDQRQMPETKGAYDDKLVIGVPPERPRWWVPDACWPMELTVRNDMNFAEKVVARLEPGRDTRIVLPESGATFDVSLSASRPCRVTASQGRREVPSRVLDDPGVREIELSYDPGRAAYWNLTGQ